MAGCPVPIEGAEPPDWSNSLVPVEMPEVTSETKMPSMLDSVNAVLEKALPMLPPFILSKKLAGKLASELQPSHARAKLVPLEVSIRGKLVSEMQEPHARKKLVTLEVSIRGKLASELHTYHARSRLVPLEVSIRGKLVSEMQENHARVKSVPLDVSISGNSVISERLLQKLLKSATAP